VALSPGKSVRIEGDKLDLGTQGYVDLSKIYLRVGVNGNGVAFSYLARF